MAELNVVITGTEVEVAGNNIIGFAMDNLVNTLTATTDQSEDWSYSLTVHMIVPDLYNVIALTRSGQTLSVDLTADMLPYSGRYEMQFTATNGDLVGHTDIFEVFVKNTLDPSKQYDPVPSEFYQIQKEVQENAQQVQQSANSAGSSAVQAEQYANQASNSAIQASGYANDAEQSAASAQESDSQSQASANQASQFATNAENSATQARQSAIQAENSATNAEQSAENAAQSASDAQQAQQAIENMTVSSQTLAPGSEATVTKTTNEGVVNLEFGIPQGEKGETGLGVPVPTIDDVGKVPVVNETGDGYVLSAASGEYEWKLIRTVIAPEDPTTDQSGVTWMVNDSGQIFGFSFDTDNDGLLFEAEEVMFGVSGDFYPVSGNRQRLNIQYKSGNNISYYRGWLQGVVCRATFNQNKISDLLCDPLFIEQRQYQSPPATLIPLYNGAGNTVPYNLNNKYWTMFGFFSNEDTSYMENFRFDIYGRFKK